ncbi:MULTISPECIES: MFS transporter [Geobacillus]|jgi:predicted MFS family arabinose efflux permease|uniref:MFS transporter n=1 Tax=Geobacillus TaxID=129337 RepID=UPI00040FEF72|nr:MULTISPECIES: MFS transporter [Geobacillus]ARA97430.1 MFS sugar transporter [Geobacillus thermodenitrificans]MEC5188275.1 putative MFS family arabinose efflux permease [Geobacillus thermodenitrificans]MED3907349.1 MFS transporter [Geobacillus thermodenitrificans]OQP07710.1 MFS transporter [Geobacillus sp. 47C-IIb]QNU30592.1 MFS transporter [Geobacillus sp. 47C-IIb]
MTLDKKRSTLALLALAVSAFAIGTTEFISVGLLPLISQDLHVSVSTAGLTVSLYALGVTFGAPILTSVTSNMSRKSLLLWIMIIFIIGNSIAASATSIGVLLVARVLSAFSHGVFMSIGSTIAASLVPENRRASAISIMFTGLTVATITGVPFGTFIGQQFGWRIAFIFIVVVGIIAFIANGILVPSNLRKGARTTLGDQFKLLTNGRLLLLFIITALGYGGTFVVFTYLSPLLQEITGFHEKTVAVILLIYGVAIAIGNVMGGKLSNQNPIGALFYMFIVQAIVLCILTFTAPFKAAAFITIILMGLLAFMNVPGLQVYVVMLAERFVPSAVDVASAINIAAFNAGIAIGSYLGGVITDLLGLIHTPWIGALMVLGAVILTDWSRTLERKDQKSVA